MLCRKTAANGHRRDLVALGGAVDFRFEIASDNSSIERCRSRIRRRMLRPDIEPDEQHGADQSEAAERHHDGGRQRDFLRACQVEASVSVCTLSTSLLHADAEADIELAGLFQNDLAVFVGVQFLLAKLEHAGLALAERLQFQRDVLKGRGSEFSEAYRGWI